MYYPPNSFLLLFFLFSMFYHLRCASSKQGLGWCETLFQCGNITASFPFWGGNRSQACGQPSLELRCNSKNITSLNISNHEYHVFHIDQTSNTLRLARLDFLGSFCSATFSSTTLPPETFELLPTNKNLTIFYLCNPRLNYLSSHTCPGGVLVSAYQSPNYYRSCRESFTVNVPSDFFQEEKELDLNSLEKVLREGFEVKVMLACQECSSSANEHYRRCSQPFSCGDKSGLLYPFWIAGREDCGHPEFKLGCSRGFAELNVSIVTFRILEANYESRSVRLARSDYTNGSCPRNPVNGQFIQNVLPFGPETELLTIYYDCQDFSTFNVPTNVYVGKFGCKNDSKDVENYNVRRNISSASLDGSSGLLFDDLRQNCKKDVSIPISGSSFNTFTGPDNLRTMLEHGVELGLNQDCSMCIESKGACGYDQISRGFVCYCNDGTHGRICGSGKRSRATFVKAIRIVLYSVAGVAVFLVLLLLFVYLRRKRKTRLRQQKLKALIPLKHYTYAQVKRITKSFAEVVGRGGFGIVYKGTLSDGRMVAVKVLKDSKGNGEDFTNEVASMSQTSHLNIVSLLGFCVESSRRAIVYEFLGNGSLDKFISGKSSTIMDSTTLFGIALGVARGLDYLHHSCKTRIVHFDIKPQNVLLDDNFCPKVSDFGLAKLCEKKESALSLLDTRGTIGYIAPEMVSRAYGNVSHKSDVYSYGMLVLEMIGARNKERAHQEFSSNTSSMYFPEWVYRDLELGKSTTLTEIGVSNEEEEITKKMTLVGLWCIQSSPSDRPPMNRVVEMMEGSLDALEVPPRPVLQQILPTSLQESSVFSEDISV